MSFERWIYWSCLLGGWSAFVGWLCAELVLGRFLQSTVFAAIGMSVLISMAIGAGLSLVGALSDFQWQPAILRAMLGLAGGFVAGLLGSLLGNGLYALFGHSHVALDFIGRVIGWTIMGAFLGMVEGAFTLSLRKFINGLIGGTIGGLIGGCMFGPLGWLVGSGVSSRAFGFVIMGLFIGFFVGLVQVVFKEAWLTVEQGFRPGRQLILGQPEITMGTSEKANLCFIAYGAKGVEPLHLKLTRQNDGSYWLEDNRSRSGTFLNDRPVNEPVRLAAGDRIRLGPNVVAFQERTKRTPTVEEASFTPVANETRPPAPVTATLAPAPATQKPKSKASVPPPVATLAPEPPPKAEAAQSQPCPLCAQPNRGAIGKRRCSQCFNVY